MNNLLDELKETSETLANIEDQRAKLVAYRNKQIHAARAAGATWDALQEATKLSRQGLANILTPKS